MPSRQSVLFDDSNICLEGFLVWNNFWNKYSIRHKLPIEIVHIAYEKWNTESEGELGKIA